MLMMLPSCLVSASTGQLVLQHLETRGPEIYPADAHDAPLLPRQMRASTGAVGSARSGSRGPCGRKFTQLMLMMLPSCLVKCAQALGQLFLQHLESKGWPCGNIPS